MNGQNNNIRPSYGQANMDELQWIQMRRQELEKKLGKSKQKMRQTYNQLTRQQEIPSGKWEKTAFLLSKSGTIINGLRMGLKVGKAINTLIQIKRTFSRKK